MSGSGVSSVPTTQFWTPSRIWHRAREVVVQEGWKSLWFKVLGETIYRRAWVIERNFERMDLSHRLPPAVEVREFAEGALDSYLELHPEADRDTITERLRAGERCFLGLWHGRPVHSMWLAPRRAYISYLQRTAELAPDEIYRGEVFTAPEARSQGIATAAVEEIARRLNAEGYRRSVGIVMPENRLGHLAYARWQTGHVVRCFWFGPWRLHFGTFPPPLTDGSESSLRSWALARVERR